MLYKPVVITDYPTAKSQITSGIDGVIVPLDGAETAKGIVAVIKNTELRDRIINYLKSHDYGNEVEVEKINRLM
jgi:glycosyltransferase involved in cell wall biosynthesis